jgi:hypothetical protein
VATSSPTRPYAISEGTLLREGRLVVTLVRRLTVVEHLYNLDFIDEIKREKLRSKFRSQSMA